MRLPILSLLVVGWFVTPLMAQKTKDTSPPKFFVESDPEGWTDLLDKDLKNWKRVSIPPKSRLGENPWKVSADGKTLICDSGGGVVHEMLLCDRELADGILHVEWKFTRNERKPGYSSGLYVRNSADGSIHHSTHLGASNVGGLGGKTLVSDKPKLFGSARKGVERVKDPCEWNTCEIVCKGTTLAMWVNGHQTTEWTKCEVPKGYFGIEGQEWFIEFRNLKWKESK